MQFNVKKIEDGYELPKKELKRQIMNAQFNQSLGST